MKPATLRWTVSKIFTDKRICNCEFLVGNTIESKRNKSKTYTE